MPLPPDPGHRHVWVDSNGGYRYPGLIMGWRRCSTGWEAQVAMVALGSVLIHWVASADLHLVVDDGMQSSRV